jgi:hypothetical protein
MAIPARSVKQKRITTTTQALHNATITGSPLTKEALSEFIQNNENVYLRICEEFKIPFSSLGWIIAVVDKYGNESRIEFKHTRSAFQRSCNNFLYKKMRDLVKCGLLEVIKETAKGGHANLNPYQYSWRITTKGYDVWGRYYQYMLQRSGQVA